MTKAPTTFDDLKARVAAESAGFPKRLGQAIQFALAHPDEIALGTAAGIAASAGVQPSTMVRLAHHLGFSGFSDFQSVFRDRLKVRASTYEERLARIESGASSGTLESNVLHGFLDAARQSVDAVAARIESAEFTRAVALLAGASTIHLIAKRRAYPLAAHMAYAFAKLGIRAQVLDTPNGIDEEAVGLADARDAAIVASFAPYASASLDLARALSARGVPIVSITDSAMSPFTALSAHWLEVAESDHAGFRPLSAAIAIAGALTVAIAERRRQKG